MYDVMSAVTLQRYQTDQGIYWHSRFKMFIIFIHGVKFFGYKKQVTKKTRSFRVIVKKVTVSWYGVKFN